MRSGTKLTYRHTLYASYLGYITQAIINNLSPLLFVTYNRQFNISLELIGLLISINFGVQITVDLIAAKYIDRIGYRISAVAAHIAATIGLVCMGILPNIMDNAYAGLVIATVINAIGGGIIEVLISPIVFSLPGEEKASAMNLLHSFYCWGHVAVVVLSTLYFNIAGIANWLYLPLIWALVPLFNTLLFSKVPLRTLVEEHERIPLRKLFTAKVFWLLFLLMISAGASEQAMSQWSSLFAEMGLGVSKTVGDLLGPCMFAVFMGLSRMYYGIRSPKNLQRSVILNSILCAVSYLIAIFSPVPALSLIGCAMVGLFVGIMWPGVFSLSNEVYAQGGTAMFAILSLGGDLGCSSGPALVGFISENVQKAGISLLSIENITEAGLKTGLLAAIIFPVVMVIGVAGLKRLTAVPGSNRAG